MRTNVSCFEVDAAEEPTYWHGDQPRVWSDDEGWHNIHAPETIPLPRCECGGKLEPYSWYEPSWSCASCGKEYNEEALKTEPTQLKLAEQLRMPIQTAAFKLIVSDRTPYSVTVGVYPTAEEAIREAEAWKANGYKTHIEPYIKTSGQMSLNIPQYKDHYVVKDGDWFIGNADSMEEAEALAEQMRAERPNAQAFHMVTDDEGWPRVTCPRCGREGCVEGGVCPRCQKKLGKRGRPSGIKDPNNPFGVTEDFSHYPDQDYRIEYWPSRDGWYIEVGDGPGGWGPFPTEQAATDYVNKKTQLGQKGLFNPRETLPGTAADIYGQ